MLVETRTVSLGWHLSGAPVFANCLLLLHTQAYLTHLHTCLTESGPAMLALWCYTCGIVSTWLHVVRRLSTQPVIGRGLVS